MEVPRIAILICTVMVISITSIPFVYAQDDSNQSATNATDEVQVIPLQSVFSISSGDESNFAQVPSSGSEMQVKSYTLQGSSSVPADMAGIEWQELLGGRGGESFIDIQPTADGNYIAAGGTGTPELVSGFSNAIDAWIMKTDPKGTLIWQKVYGSNLYDQAMSIRQTNDPDNTKGYIFAGFSNSTDGNFTSNHGKEDGWVVKLDKNGNFQWQTLLGGSGSEWLMSVRQIPDNSGYIVAGYTESDNISGTVYKGNTDIFVAKLSNNGSVVWQKVIGGDNYDFGSSIIPASDGGFILAGYSRSGSVPQSNSNHGYNDILIMKLDDAGEVQWSKLLGGCQGEATAFDNIIQQTPEGGYILIGQTLSSLHRCGGDVTGNTHGSADVWVVKLDKRGNIQWQNLLGGTGYDDGGVIHQTPHGDYIIAGRTTSDNSGDVGQNNGPRDTWDAWVAKLDSNGQLLWQDTLGGSGYDQCTAIQPMPDEGFILSVYTRSSDSGNIGTNHGYEDAWLAKLKPRLVVDVKDSNSHSWVPNTTVFLHDVVNKTDRNLTAMINGRVVFTGSDESDQFPLVKGRNYTVRSVADNYYNNTPKEVTFTQDGLLVNLSQQPKYAPTNNTFSITCVENYDNICGNDSICSLSGSFDECDNVASNLIKAGYTMNFYHKDDEVTLLDFNYLPFYPGPTISDSAFHYHTGHGSDFLNHSIVTYLQLKGWPSLNPLNNRIIAADLPHAWGGKNKYVMLDSCFILRDKSWGNVLSTSHGILGWTSYASVRSDFPDQFFEYAIGKKWKIKEAYKQATLDVEKTDNMSASIITRNNEQLLNDHFPGQGSMAPDGGSQNEPVSRIQWDCKRGNETW
jgi:hypothetical protein